MRRRQPVDLTSHLNQIITRGNPADFPVSLRPLLCVGPDGYNSIPSRRAIVREDTGQAIAVVSNRYSLVPHSAILDTVERAIEPLDVGPVPRGIYLDRQGARMRALFKFPALARPIVGQDEICPCLQVKNTYDGTSRISLHIGAFRFVCTNLAVGGGGVFAGGFVSIHAGEIPIEKMADQLAAYLARFDAIIEAYRRWSERHLEAEGLDLVLKLSLRGQFEALRDQLLASRPATVFDAYNRLTHHATHGMRSAATAFEMLERVNASFQKLFPVIDVKPVDSEEKSTAESLVAVGESG